MVQCNIVHAFVFMCAQGHKCLLQERGKGATTVGFGVKATGSSICTLQISGQVLVKYSFSLEMSKNTLKCTFFPYLSNYYENNLVPSKSLGTPGRLCAALGKFLQGSTENSSCLQKHLEYRRKTYISQQSLPQCLQISY